MVIIKMPGRSKTFFQRYIGIDYSGAKTPTSSLKGLRVYEGHLDAAPIEVQPPPSPRKYWTRRGVAQWLVEYLSENVPTIVGIDHSFSFPLSYLLQHFLYLRPLPQGHGLLRPTRGGWYSEGDDRNVLEN